MKPRKIAINVAVSLIGLLIALFIAEMILRAYVPVLGPMYRADSITGYSLKPNVSVNHRFPNNYDVHYETNSLGFRNPEITMPKPEGVCRVLGLGDSQTMGIGVERDDTYLSILQTRLQSRTPQSRIEVINAGVPGWGTSQELARLEHMGANLEPDIVIVGVGTNDTRDSFKSGLYRISDSGTLESTPLDKRPQWFPERQLITRLPGYDYLANNSAIFNWIRAIYTRSRAGDLTPEVSPDVLYQDDWLQLEALLMRQMNVIASEIKARLIFVLIPSAEPGQIRESIAPYQQICTQEKLACLNIADAVIDSGLTRDEIRYPNDPHWRPRGHLLIAEALDQFLGDLSACAEGES